MRMAIRYLTTFTYDTHVSESQNALRAKPASGGRQLLVNYSVTVDPAARIFSRRSTACIPMLTPRPGPAGIP